MYVVEKDDERALARDESEERERGFEEAKSVLRRIGRCWGRFAPLEVRQVTSERRDARALCMGGCSRDACEGTQRFDPGPIGRRAARFPRAAPGDLRAA